MRGIGNGAMAAIVAGAITFGVAAAKPQVTALDAVEIEQERLVVTPLAPALVGDEITAIVHLYNPAAEPRKTTVHLKVDGQLHAAQAVTVSAKARLPVPMRLYLDGAKAYEVATGQLTVDLPNAPTRNEPAGKQHHHRFERVRCRCAFDVEGRPGNLGKLLSKGFTIAATQLKLA